MNYNNNYKYKESYLFVLPWTLTSFGGVNQVVENLFYQMKLDGKYDPIIIVNSWDDIKIRRDNINGIDHYFLRLRSPWNSSQKIINFTLFFLQFFRTTWFFYGFIKNNKISTINVHYCSLSALNISILKALRIFKGRFILSFHGKDFLNAKKSLGIERVLWKFMINSSDNIITCSEYLKDAIVKFNKSQINKIISIHNGIDIDLKKNSEVRHIPPCFEGKKFILNVATLEFKKGQDVLLKAFKEISQEYIDVSLVLIGRPGGTENQIKKLIKSLGLCERVDLVEGLSHDQVLAFMEKAMIFVLPSRFEPFGIVILEAGVFDVPVIASNVGGIREILIHDITGKLCEPEDIYCLANELRNLLQSSEERNRLGENLGKHVIENFSWNRTYKKYLDCIGL